MESTVTRHRFHTLQWPTQWLSDLSIPLEGHNSHQMAFNLCCTPPLWPTPPVYYALVTSLEYDTLEIQEKLLQSTYGSRTCSEALAIEAWKEDRTARQTATVTHRWPTVLLCDSGIFQKELCSPPVGHIRCLSGLHI